MCSVAWTHAPAETGYELVFNRDEQWTRGRSERPRFETEAAFPGFCSRDPDAGGTWLYANTAGLTLALLNAYPTGAPGPRGARTRGVLPLIASEVGTRSEALSRLEGQTWSDFSPCHLLIFAPDGVSTWLWDGETFAEEALGDHAFHTSSGVRSEAVVAARRERFARHRAQRAPLVTALSDRSESGLGEALYVAREDAGTVSQTRVVVGPERVDYSLTWRDESPISLSAPRR